MRSLGFSGESVRVQARYPSLRPEDILTIAKTIIYEISGRAESGSDRERVETTGLNSGGVLATLKDLERERPHPEARVLFEGLLPRPKDQDEPEPSPGASGREQGRPGTRHI